MNSPANVNPGDLFTMALGLTPPWKVTEVTLNQEVGELHLTIDFAQGSRFNCPHCGQPECAVHDTDQRQWRHLNFFQYACYVHARQPRIKCPTCGVKTVPVPWARPGSGFFAL